MPLNSPILTGDVSGGLHSTSVDKLKAQPLAGTAPTAGQTLTWTGTAWAPSTPSTGGGGGANGLTYYLNQSTDADAPVTGIPGTPKQLGRTGQVTQVDVTSGELTPDIWTLVAGFVSEVTPQDPATTLIPAGLWDFNVWALGVADQNHSNSIRTRAYIYNGTTLTPLATSAVQAITATSAQYALSMLVEQTTLLATDRIYVAIEAFATANGHTVTAQFGDNTPSHVHTSLGLIGGTGLWKNTAGILQNPASLLVDADVDPAAAIAQSKIAGLTSALGAKAAQAQVEVYSTAGTFTWTKPAGARAYVMEAVGGGGGGGAGGKTASGTAVFGGSGGGGGGLTSVTYLASDLTEASYTVEVGAGGTGGVQGGAAPVIGGISTITGAVQGVILRSTGGGPGGSGATSAGAAGTAGLFSGNTGTASNITANAGAGAANSRGGSGGGGGGGCSATAPFDGGNGGSSITYQLAGGAGGAASTIANGGIGANGNAKTTLTSGLLTGSGGGGGGASRFATGSGGNGGNGAGNGTGGGGGGATNGSGSGGTGGNGAKGIVVITSYF